MLKKIWKKNKKIIIVAIALLLIFIVIFVLAKMAQSDRLSRQAEQEAADIAKKEQIKESLQLKILDIFSVSLRILTVEDIKIGIDGFDIQTTLSDGIETVIAKRDGFEFVITQEFINESIQAASKTSPNLVDLGEYYNYLLNK